MEQFQALNLGALSTAQHCTAPTLVGFITCTFRSGWVIADAEGSSGAPPADTCECSDSYNTTLSYGGGGGVSGTTSAARCDKGPPLSEKIS